MRRLGLMVAVGLTLVGCNQGGGKTRLVNDRADLTEVLNRERRSSNAFLDEVNESDVTNITRAAAEAIADETMVIAVTNREGEVLGVYRKANATPTVFGNFLSPVNSDDFAVSLARTGAFFSNDQAPLSSRTVRFISGIHFPPGITNKPNAALYGIENTNRGCPLAATDPVTRSKSLAGLFAVAPPACDNTTQTGCGLGIATGKADVFDSNPASVTGGGVPIFKDGQLVGGIGVAGPAPQLAEFAAFVGSVPGARFGPRPAEPGVVILDGIELPFVEQTTRPPGVGPGVFEGAVGFGRPLNAPTPNPRSDPNGVSGVPDGWLINASMSAEFSQTEVMNIVAQAVAQADRTRAAIRLPLGSTTRMVIAVSDLQGAIRGLFRMPDSTIFSIDVAVAKARNVVYFSSFNRVPNDLPADNGAVVPLGTAVTNRTISFGAQPLYPPGIDGTSPGPFFQLYVNDVATPCRQGSQPTNANQSGIVFFPGSMPLYRNGQLVGGLGVSGDGVEQDDLVTAAGATGFAPPLDIRADQIEIRGARLPFLKFPRNPEAL